MRVIIDRFEAEFAVVELEDRTTVNMPKMLLPERAKEGDVLDININTEATEERKSTISKLMQEVWE